MNTVELFCGTKSVSKVAKEKGHRTYTIDNDPQFYPDNCVDIFRIFKLDFLGKIDIFWASPPCQSFSVASMGKHWNKDNTPKTEKAVLGIEILRHTIRLILRNKPTYWFIENPRGKMRKVIDQIFKEFGITHYVRHTVTYCQYSDSRMKPTDIWTNCLSWKPRPACKNGDNCHEKAPRGSKTGTQGLKGAKERGVIPSELFKEIFDSIEK